MKMKFYLIILALLANVTLKGQGKTESFPNTLFDGLLKEANSGNSKAMNGVGVYYLSGKSGISINKDEAYKWFQKSALAGYPTAWFNIGTMYKDGNGKTQDFKKAFQAFLLSIKPSSYPIKHQSFYTLGYMSYKGMGCPQSYFQSIAYFRKGISMSSPECMYMLGLCFRNGYGIQTNIDSARYWLTRSSKRGYSYANEELKTLEPETAKQPLISDIAKVPPVKAINVKEGYQKISHRIFDKDISGQYTGHLIKFDWSGKFIIEQVPLSVNLKVDNKMISGEWNENDRYKAKLTGKLTDSCIIFENTDYELNDHYNREIPTTFEFRKTSLKVDVSRDTVYLTGNLELYSKKLREPEKPIFLILIRNSTKTFDPSLKNEPASDLDVSNYVAFPNPFTDVLQVNYKLNKTLKVKFVVTSVLTGKIVYDGPVENPAIGEVNTVINVNGATGWYILTQYYGNKHRSNLIYKN